MSHRAPVAAGVAVEDVAVVVVEAFHLAAAGHSDMDPCWDRRGSDHTPDVDEAAASECTPP